MEIDELLCEFQVVKFPPESAIYLWGYNQSGQTAIKGNESHLRIPKSLPPKLFAVSGEGKSLWSLATASTRRWWRQMGRRTLGIKEKRKTFGTPFVQSWLLPFIIDVSSAARTHPTLGRISH